jgi:hypothetical protein
MAGMIFPSFRGHGAWHFALVASLGAAGAVIGVFLPFADGAIIDINTPNRLYIAVPAGSLAAVVLVFLLANTDRSDIPRLLAISALAGVFWKPVIDAGGLYIDRVGQAGRATEVTHKVEEVKQTVGNVSANDLDPDAGVERVRQLAQEINILAPSINDHNLLEQLRTKVEVVLPPEQTNGDSVKLREEFRTALTPDAVSIIGLQPTHLATAPGDATR